MPCSCGSIEPGGSKERVCVCVFESSDESSADESSGSVNVKSTGRSDSTSSNETITVPHNTPSKRATPPLSPPTSETTRAIAEERPKEEDSTSDELSSPKRAFKLIQIAEKLRAVLTSPVHLQRNDHKHSDVGCATSSAFPQRMHNLDTGDFERVEKWRYQVDYERVSNPLEMVPPLPFQGLYGMELKVGITPNGVLTPSVLSTHGSFSADQLLMGQAGEHGRLADGLNLIPGDASVKYIDLLGAGNRMLPHMPNWKSHAMGEKTGRPKFLHRLFLNQV